VTYGGDGNFLGATNALVQVVNALQPLVALNLQDNGNDTVTVTFQGTPGVQYFVQANSDLSQPFGWAVVSTNTAGINGLWTYTEAKAGRAQRFYRGALPAQQLIVTPQNMSRTYGATNPILTGTMTGLQNGDTITVSYSTVANPGSQAGSYNIVPTLTDPDHQLGKYLVTLNQGTLTVDPAPLTITANDQSRIYGATKPPLTGTLTGVLNGDDITATYSTPANLTSGVGTYSIVGALHDPTGRLGNYLITTNNGILTVTPAPSATAVASSQNPSAQGSNVTFTVSVGPVSPATGIPTGNIQFFTNGIAAGTAVPLAGGTASASVSNLPAGANSLTVAYLGDANFLSSSNSLTQLVTSSIDRPKTLAIADNHDGTVTVTFQGTPGAEYLVQASSDLAAAGSWSSVSTNVAGTNGFWTYRESVAGHPQRFYRSAKTLETSLRLQRPETLGILDNGNGTVTVSFRGTPGSQYIVQGTTNLAQPSAWANISTNTVAADGLWSLTEAKTAGMKFYRAGYP
jgi:hypothetical protein